MRFPIIPCLISVLTLLDRGAVAQIPTEQVEFFESRIRPVLAQECYECHNSRGKEKGGLILDHRAAWQRGGDSGPLLLPGDPSGSLLMRAIRHEVPDLEMPKAGAKLDDAIVADFEKWIAWGAPDPRDAPPSDDQLAADTDWEAIRDRRKSWWSFQPIRKPAVPEIAGAIHPVDRFIRARLAAEGLEPAAKADPRSLVRRLHFTLTGLPPSPGETAAFLADWEKDPAAAVTARTDALLASPAFGEKWARHWMDWTRYADTHGSEGDPEIPHAWRYRDYLIRALNADVPYDQLVREHLAGDLMEQPRINDELKLNESALGIGHLRMVFHGFSPTDALDERVRFTDDQINTVTKAFLGLTVSCARCHNHKFDAISQADYFALYGIFTSPLPATIAVDAPGILEKNRAALTALKPEIRRGIAGHWLAALPTDPAAYESAIAAAAEPKHPLHLLWKLSRSAEAWRSIRSDHFTKLAESERIRSGGETRLHWDLADPEAMLTGWNRFGEGLLDEEAASPIAGDFAIAPEGDRVMEAILPSGLYSHRLSTRHRAVLASQPFDLDGEYDLYLNVAGEGSSARYAVQHYPRSGTIFPVNNLSGGDWRWLRYDLDYWKGDRIHIELATAGDAPILVKGEPRSWFGIREALLVKKGTPAPADPASAFLAPLFATAGDTVPASPREVAAIIAPTLQRLIDQWRRADGTLDDASAHFLQTALRAGWLPNELDTMPAALRDSVARYRALEGEIPLPTRAPGVLETRGRDEPLMVRGDHKQPGDAVPRRFLEAIDATPYGPAGSGRLEFARDLLREDNPFTTRVIVNRVWHHLFGEGLVPTPDNFGRLGEMPSHPELLDYLAGRFRDEQQWSLKKLIRDLMLSDTWQQSAEPSPAALERDPANRLLSHHGIHRLEAESIRDAFLATTGQLDPARYGPPVDGAAPRRSVYLRVRRNDLDPLLTTFDFPVPASATGRRDVTNVPAQSLTLLNDPFIISQAGRWAATLEGQDDDARIRRLFETALTRPPTASETAQALTFLQALDEEHRADAARLTELVGMIGRDRAALSALVDPVRQRLLKSRETDSAPAPPADLRPIAAWDFSAGLRDTVGGLEGRLIGSARHEGGELILDGNGHFASAPLRADLGAKTLEALVRLDTPDQKGGGVITVQDLRGGLFDSVVYAEREPGRWLAGSNGFARTLDFGGPEETEAASRPVHLAIVYEADGTIRGYRDGLPYGEPIRKAPLQRYAAGDTQVILGLRHGTDPGGSRALKGRILKARLYDRALPPDEIRAAAGARGAHVTGEDILKALSQSQRGEKARLEAAIAAAETELADLRRLGSDLPLDQRRWRDLAHALFNLKEFIYLR
jgi:hypothetical protein